MWLNGEMGYGIGSGAGGDGFNSAVVASFFFDNRNPKAQPTPTTLFCCQVAVAFG